MSDQPVTTTPQNTQSLDEILNQLEKATGSSSTPTVTSTNTTTSTAPVPEPIIPPSSMPSTPTATETTTTTTAIPTEITSPEPETTTITETHTDTTPIATIPENHVEATTPAPVITEPAPMVKEEPSLDTANAETITSPEPIETPPVETVTTTTTTTETIPAETTPVTPTPISSPKKKFSLKPILAAVVLVVSLVGVAVGAYLAQQSQENVSHAGICCNGGQCNNLDTFGGDTNAGQSSCGARAQEFCGSRGGVKSGGGSCTAPAPTSSTTTPTGFNQAACTSACQGSKGTVNGGVVGGRQLTGKNDGNVANCECYCQVGNWIDGFSKCDGGQAGTECTSGQTGIRNGVSYTCVNGNWIPTVSSSATPVPGTLPPGAECNPGSRASGNTSYNIDADIQCGTCSEGSTFGRYCTFSGHWSTACVRAHACGYTTNVECGDTDQNATTPDITCASRGYPAASCFNFRCVDNQTNDYFIGCDPTDPCKNCWKDNATGAVTCRLEDSSCSANINCRTPTATPGTFTCYRCHSGADFCESYTSTTACSTNCNSCPGSTPTPPPFVCLGITKDIATPTFGQSVRYTCGTVTGAVRYEFQYKVGDIIGVVPTLSAASNITQPFPITHTGTYKVQCRPCNSTSCTPWVEAWTGQACGGIANIKCPTGLTCNLGANAGKPDASGTCAISTAAPTR